MKAQSSKIITVLCAAMLILNVSPCAYVFAANQMPTDSYSFQIITEPPDTTPPYTLGHLPLRDAVEVSTDSNIEVRIRDDDSGVDIDSIVMMVNGQKVNPVITGSPSEYTLSYDPGADFILGQQVFVSIDASDLAP